MAKKITKINKYHKGKRKLLPPKFYCISAYAFQLADWEHICGLPKSTLTLAPTPVQPDRHFRLFKGFSASQVD